MRIGIFVVMAGRSAGGPETYEHALVRELAAIDRNNEYRVYCLSRAAAESFDVRRGNVSYHVLGPSVRILATAVSLPKAMKRHGVDILHATFVPPPFSSRPCVLTMHGSVTFAHPEYFTPLIRWRLNALLKRGIRRARVIPCVSRHVRDYIAERFGLPDERLAVVYNGVGEQFRPVGEDRVGEAERRYGLERPYVLYVGKLMRGKNADGLIRGYAGFRRETGAGLPLVVAGGVPRDVAKTRRLADKLGIGDSVRLLGYVRHDDLPALYGGAEMSLFPSLWEGFGLPVLEAMACGTPVVTSNVSCLPEIAGGAAVLVDPHSDASIAEGITRLYADEQLREDLKRKGLRRAAEFTWRRTAEQMLDVYRRAAEA